jgi:hypothetical protein
LEGTVTMRNCVRKAMCLFYKTCEEIGVSVPGYYCLYPREMVIKCCVWKHLFKLAYELNEIFILD